MALELFISRRAAREIERVVEWWAAHRPAAPGAVRQDLEAAVNILLVQPDIGASVEEASSPDVRRFHLDRIRYWVYYSLLPSTIESPRNTVRLARQS